MKSHCAWAPEERSASRGKAIGAPASACPPAPFPVAELATAVTQAMSSVVKEMGAQTQTLAAALLPKPPPPRPTIRPTRAALENGGTLVVGAPGPAEEEDYLGGLSHAASSILEASAIVEHAADDVRRIAAVARKAGKAFEFEAARLDQSHLQLRSLGQQLQG